MKLTEQQIIKILEKYDIDEYHWKLEVASELLALQGEPTKDMLDEKAIVEFDLNDLFDDLQNNAYNVEYHNYYYKEANQIIRKHFEAHFNKDIPDDMIEKWADNEVKLLKDIRRPTFDLANTIIICFRAGLREGAKAMRDGTMAEWAKKGKIMNYSY